MVDDAKVVDDRMRIRRSPHVAAHGLGGTEGGVLLHLESGQYHGVDSVGWAIWNLLDNPRNIPELAAEVRREYPDAPEHLAEDVRAFVQDLLHRNLVEMAHETGN